MAPMFFEGTNRVLDEALIGEAADRVEQLAVELRPRIEAAVMGGEGDSQQVRFTYRGEEGEPREVALTRRTVQGIVRVARANGMEIV